MMLCSEVCHAFFRFDELGSVQAQETVSMQEEFLGVDVMVWDFIVFQVGMRLLEYLEVVMFVFFIFLGSIVSFLDPAWV